MREQLELPDLPGYFSIKQAADFLGLSDKRVYQLIDEGRIPAFRGGRAILLPREAVEQFRPKCTGRPRKNTPVWHVSPPGQLTTWVSVRLRPHQMRQFQHMLHALKEHILLGTVARYMINSVSSPGTVDILFIWGRTPFLNEAARKQAMEEFQVALADVVDWSTAQYADGEVIMHT